METNNETMAESVAVDSPASAALAACRDALKDGAATLATLTAAVAGLLSSGAIASPEGSALLTELGVRIQAAQRVEELSEWKREADVLAARHIAERSQLFGRASAAVRNLTEHELWGFSGAKPATATGGAVAPVSGLTSGLYRHPDGRVYVLDTSKPGRRPEWLTPALRVSA